MIDKLLAFVWRDFVTESSYKLNFLLQLFNLFASLLIFFFLSKLFEGTEIAPLKPYGGDYFSFIVVGGAFFAYFDAAIQSLTKSIRDGQMLGTLEALLVTQTEIPVIILASSLYSLIWATLKMITYLMAGVFLFGMDLSQTNLIGVAIMLLLTITAFGSFGILAASFVMVLKKGDPISFVLTNLSRLFGGFYYPISVLPDWLQIISFLLPVTYVLEGMRLAFLQGYSVAQLLPNIIVLGIFSVVMLPFSIWVFAKAVQRAKRDGTLTQY
ncbi:MAG: ABC transporter permease [Candidatus Parabeggiatoa sp. nov. 1]|nr:MAG: ABC transporter permease [Gammaproteobacteria bacterium]